jgi:hypothetical protein
MTDPTSRQRGRPKKDYTVTLRKKKEIYGQNSQIWARHQDILTDHQSQCDFDFDFETLTLTSDRLLLVTWYRTSGFFNILIVSLRLPFGYSVQWSQTFYTPEAGNRSCSRNVVFYSFQNTGWWSKSENPVILNIIRTFQHRLWKGHYEKYCYMDRNMSEVTGTGYPWWSPVLQAKFWLISGPTLRSIVGQIALCYVIQIWHIKPGHKDLDAAKYYSTFHNVLLPSAQPASHLFEWNQQRRIRIYNWWESQRERDH